MGDILYQKFLDEEVTDINLVLTLYGVTGILERFEEWLKTNEYLRSEKERKLVYNKKWNAKDVEKI